MSRKLVLLAFLSLFVITVLISYTTSSQSLCNKQCLIPQSGTIYIRPNGSIDPPTANITSADNVTYTFTDNINDSIVVERNNIIIDGNGYTLLGNGSKCGFLLSCMENVTIQNTNIVNFSSGVGLSQSSFNIVSGNNITANSLDGVVLWLSSDNNTVSGNNIAANSLDGIMLAQSSNNSISGNNITDNHRGIYLGSSSNNKFYHNNFIGNYEQVVIRESGYANLWDNGAEGNYWSDCNESDSNYDGIWDTPYVIDELNKDNYPLMGVFSCFNTSLGRHVNVISNSTIEDFDYFVSNSTIKMYVSNMTENQTYGFCRVCIPHTLMDESNISVVLDNGVTPVLHPNYNVYDNGTHRWIYFAYEHSTHKIDIIPEFQLLFVLPVFMIVTLLAVMVYKRKHGVP